MLVKGTVQKEELQGQMGLYVQGSVDVMCKTLNVSSQQLVEMMSKGEVQSHSVMPAFLNNLLIHMENDLQ